MVLLIKYLIEILNDVFFFVYQKDHLKKRGTPPSLIKSHSTASAASGDKYRHLEDDVLTLGQMTDLAKTITIPHQVSILFFLDYYKSIKILIF
jgi:hypothetical protein